MATIEMRAAAPEDKPWITQVLRESWGDTRVVSYGRLHDADRLPGLVALVDGQRLGLVTYRIDGEDCELVTLNSLKSGLGIGSKLIEAVLHQASEAGCWRVWLVTTNDNLHALGFYQKRGFRLVELRAGAIEESRRLKPSIPQIGQDGIPIVDELVLERKL